MNTLGFKARDNIWSAGRRITHQFFLHSNIAFATLDEDFRYTSVNPKSAWMHNMSAEAHIGKTPREILGTIATPVVPIFSRVLSSGRPAINFELIGVSHGQLARVALSLFPITNERGRILQIGAIVLDLPDRSTKSIVTSESQASHVLRSWKEIAQYLGACVKTVQRWELLYKFPIRRVQNAKGSMVFAFKEEVDQWMRVGAGRGSSKEP